MVVVRARWVLVATGLVVIVVAAGALAFGPGVRVGHRLFEDVVMDNVPSGVACPDLPPLPVVRQALSDRGDLVARIEAVGAPGEVDVRADSPCGGDDHAEILITYPGHQHRLRIQEIMRADRFPVPVSLRNV